MVVEPFSSTPISFIQQWNTRTTSDSRVLKTFLVSTLDGINNYVFAKPDLRILRPYQHVNEIRFWLKFNTGEYITSGYPVLLDLRIVDV